MKKKSTLILGISFFVSMLLPMLFLNSHHHCNYDECFYIFYDGKLGMCVEKAIDRICMAIAFIWMYLPAIIIFLYKHKHTLSPFIFIGLLIALVVFLAFVDPAKWTFVIGLLASSAIVTTIVVIDSRNILKTRNT